MNAPNDSDEDDVLKVRKPDPQMPNLEAPRPVSWMDLIYAERRRLVARDKRLKPSPFAKDLSTRAYDYTRRSSLTNDDLGYGERVAILMTIDNTSKDARIGQRTKTGLQVLVVASNTPDAEPPKTGRKRRA